MSCELSPLVFAELYRLLAAERARAEVLEDRLAQIDLDVSWLTEAAEQYEGAWRSRLRSASTIDELTAVSSDHAVLASWVLASLRGTGPCYELGDLLRTKVTERVVSEVTDLRAELPSRWKPVIFGWTLGMVAGGVDHDLPVLPALLPADENVRAAYEGLIEHVLLLGSLNDPWPEMAGTSVFWRGMGLAEAMIPEAANGQQAIKQLVIAVRRLIPEMQGSRLGHHFTGFTERRNTLSHVADMPGRPRFVDVKDEARTWDQIRLTVLGITQFLGSQVAFELTGSASRSIRPGTWYELIWELKTFD